MTESQELSQEVRMLGEYLRLRALMVEPGGVDTAALDQLLHTQPVFWELSDCEDGFEVFGPEPANKRMTIQGGEQLGSDFIENSQHLHEMTVVLFLLDLLLTHHLYLVSNTDVNLLWLDIFYLANALFHQLISQFMKLLLDSFGALFDFLFEIN